MSTFWHHLQTSLGQNSFFSGGAVLMLLGAILALLRRAPVHLWHTILRTCTTTVTVRTPDSAYSWVEAWLDRHPVTRKTGMLVANCTTSQAFYYESVFFTKTPDDRKTIPVYFSPAVGLHWMFYANHLTLIYRNRRESTVSVSSNGHGQMPSEEITLRFFTRNRELPRRFILEARDAVIPADSNLGTAYATQSQYSGHATWEAVSRIPLRRPESVVLRAGLMEDLLGDLDRFIADEDWYHRCGVPYRRGYLLEGPPGSGKSSAVLAMAQHLGWDICTLSLEGDGLSGWKLRKLLGNRPPKTFILIEDIDREIEKLQIAAQQVTDDEPVRPSFSAVLNTFDGLAAGTARIIVITANDVSKLDDALIRPGRIDRRFHLGHATEEQAERLYVRFFPEYAEHARRFADQLPPDTSMAALQHHLMTYRDDPERAAREPVTSQQLPTLAIEEVSDERVA